MVIDLYTYDVESNAIRLGWFDCQNIIPNIGDTIFTEENIFEVMAREIDYRESDIEIRLFVEDKP